MKALQERKLLLPRRDFKCYKVIKKQGHVLIHQCKKAPEVRVTNAQGAAARAVRAEHMRLVCRV